MAQFVKTDKDFLTIHATDADILSIGGLGICDGCSQISSNGYIIGVLGNRWYCNECFTEWHTGAINYPEDREYEMLSIKKYIGVFKLNF